MFDEPILSTSTSPSSVSSCAPLDAAPLQRPEDMCCRKMVQLAWAVLGGLRGGLARGELRGDDLHDVFDGHGVDALLASLVFDLFEGVDLPWEGRSVDTHMNSLLRRAHEGSG